MIKGKTSNHDQSLSHIMWIILAIANMVIANKELLTSGALTIATIDITTKEVLIVARVALRVKIFLNCIF
jgi:hypothetical protein